MSSLLTNTSAISAVANLTATQQSLSTVQNQISTGLKVASASDNSAYFSIATTLRTQTGQLGAVSDALNLGSSVLNTATAGYSNTTSLLQSISNQLVTASSSAVDRGTIQTTITAIQAQLQTAASSASFNGVNLLAGGVGSTQATIVTSVTGSGTSAASVSVVTLNQADYQLTGSNSILGTTSATANSTVLSISLTSSSTSGDVNTAITAVNTAIAAVTTANAKLGAQQANISLQQTFISSLSDSITTGVGSLVDANLNEASTKLSALQTQQSLGIQSLSIANQNSQSLLRLFQ